MHDNAHLIIALSKKFLTRLIFQRRLLFNKKRPTFFLNFLGFEGYKPNLPSNKFLLTDKFKLF